MEMRIRFVLQEEEQLNALDMAEKAVTQLSGDELAQFRQWFAEYDGDRWDAQIEADAETGKLDELAREALAEYEAGRTPEI
jgi:hypothetical protein